MTIKKFVILRLFIVFTLAAVVSASVVAGNRIVPIVAFITALALMRVMKKQVKEVLADERDFAAGGRAARYALSAYSLVAVIAAIILFSLRDASPAFGLVGAVLAYSACGLLLAYSFLYKYFISAPDKSSVK